MKILFDQNLSPRLPKRLADVFPGSEHVDDIGLGAVPDDRVWEYAKMYAFAIVSKDVDFSQLSVLHGTPPKVLWLLIGNCTTAEMEAELRVYRDDILAFDADATAGVLTIG